MAVADGGSFQPQPARGQEMLQPQVRHHRRDQHTAAQRSGLRPAARDQRHKLIPVGDGTVFVDDHDAVRVAVQTQSHIRAVADHRLGRRSHRGRSAILVDVEAVG